MTKTMTTKDAVTLYSNLKSIVDDTNKRLPGNITWAVYRSFTKVEEINKDYETMKNNKFIEMYKAGKAQLVDGSNGNLFIPEEHLPEFMEFLNDIDQSDVDIEIHTISESAFESLLDKYELSVKEIAGIAALVKKEKS